MFFGLYPLVRHNVPLPCGQRDIFDLMGTDAIVFRYTEASGEAADTRFIAQAQGWFDSIWDNISFEFPV